MIRCSLKLTTRSGAQGQGDFLTLLFARCDLASLISVKLQSMNDPVFNDNADDENSPQSADRVSDERSGYLVEQVYLLDDDPDV